MLALNQKSFLPLCERKVNSAVSRPAARLRHVVASLPECLCDETLEFDPRHSFNETSAAGAGRFQQPTRLRAPQIRGYRANQKGGRYDELKERCHTSQKAMRGECAEVAECGS